MASTPRTAPSALRTAITERLGLPETASNTEVFAALDARLAAQRQAHRRPATRAQGSTLSAADAALYKAAFG